ncbi:plasmid-related transcriptional repressor protein [Limnobacter sp.]|uniref:plasmid-related transcriptional repressor protein n=1 Tax=Limnobacter sp. TaxID=2003368 RepID=UPI0025BC57ED|nr:plasmid-related transcriptional repressor protein [Limnobacter sp.]
MSLQLHSAGHDLSQTLDRLHQRSQEAKENIEKKAAVETRELFLPGFEIGVFPNHLNRSSLFAPIARGHRKFHRKTIMVTRRDCILEYTGEQMDEADADLMMALIFFAQPFPFGSSVPLNRARLLRKIERNTGKGDYEWLHRRMKAMTEATFFLEATKPDGTTRYTIGKTKTLRIIAEFDFDGSEYSYKLDPRWVTMFGNKEYSLTNWEKRMWIKRGHEMAKTMERLVATSNETVQRFALEWLKRKMGYSSPMRKYREALDSACKELARVGIITTHKIEISTKGSPQLTIWKSLSG